MKSPLALFRKAKGYKTLYNAAVAILGSEETESACYLGMVVAKSSYDPSRGAEYRTYAIGKMRDCVKSALFSAGIRKEHLPAVDLVEFKSEEESNSSAVRDPMIWDNSESQLENKDTIDLIRRILPRFCLEAFFRWYGIDSEQQDFDQIGQSMGISAKRAEFMCRQSFHRVRKELVG